MENVVKGPPRWRLMIGLLFLHMGAFLGPMFGVLEGLTWPAVLCAYLLYEVRKIIVTVFYHRHLTHRAFECQWWIRWTMAMLATLSLQGSGRDWRRDHLPHHARTDREGDPHSPHTYIPTNRRPTIWDYVKAVIWSQLGWLLFESIPPKGYVHPAILDKDPVVVWQHRLYWPIGVGVGFVIPYLLFGLSGLWLCGFVGVVFTLHCTWLVNSVCHLWGRPALDPKGRLYVGDKSRDNWLVASLTAGEGWHATHHAKQNSAQLGIDRYDSGWQVIEWLERRGWAWKVIRFVS